MTIVITWTFRGARLTCRALRPGLEKSASRIRSGRSNEFDGADLAGVRQLLTPCRCSTRAFKVAAEAIS